MPFDFNAAMAIANEQLRRVYTVSYEADGVDGLHTFKTLEEARACMIRATHKKGVRLVTLTAPRQESADAMG